MAIRRGSHAVLALTCLALCSVVAPTTLAQTLPGPGAANQYHWRASWAVVGNDHLVTTTSAPGGPVTTTSDQPINLPESEVPLIGLTSTSGLSASASQDLVITVWLRWVSSDGTPGLDPPTKVYVADIACSQRNCCGATRTGGTSDGLGHPDVFMPAIAWDEASRSSGTRY